MVAPNPMTVKGSTNIQPATTNEALIMLFTQMESLQENMKTMMDDIKDIKEDLKTAYESQVALEKRLIIEERDKKILIGVLSVIVPTVLIILAELFLF
jgi:uncharacterized protein (UPF0335 family)